jgi:hypothetical protein
VVGDAIQTTDQSALERLSEPFASKWDGDTWAFTARDGKFYHPAGFEVLAYAVAPKKVLAFAQGTFGHTVHRFPES